MMCHRTYGRGSGEREYHPIPMRPFRPKVSRLFEAGHVAYPQTGVYASVDPVSSTAPSKAVK